MREDGAQLGDALLSGHCWSAQELTFAFPDSAADYGYDDHAGAFQALNAAQKAAARAAFAMVASLTGLRFSELEGQADRAADLRLAMGGEPATAWAYLPSAAEQGGDAWFNPHDYADPAIGTYAFATFLHEIGHALGLKHGHESGFAGRLPWEKDSHEYSLMTYR
ncbi:MAG TPA: matrixin family metalloprotease, partial [Paracoccaceae bacterium]|nr:matrixin family metalloprotease [Paracoccaceae bacterium]